MMWRRSPVAHAGWIVCRLIKRRYTIQRLMIRLIQLTTHCKHDCRTARQSVWKASVVGENTAMNSVVAGENGFVRTGKYDEEMTMHESTSREIQMDRYSGLGRPTNPPSQDFSQWLFHLAANGLSFPLRLRGSGGFAPLFLTSIRLLKNNKPIEHKMSRVN
jgi:hypothetical protein